MKRVWLWWSSGKDSAWAFSALRANPDVWVERWVTTVTPTFDRVAIHGTRRSVLQAQADACGMALEEVELPFPCTNEQYEQAVGPTLVRARELGATTMAFGDLFLGDVRDYRIALLEGSGLDLEFPIWGSDTGVLARTMVDAGLEARITSLDPRRLPRGWAGRPFDHAFLDELPEGVDPCGENGEFHTCVTWAPGFDRAVTVRPGAVVDREGFVYADLLLDPGQPKPRPHGP